jgi:hypothetical protein
MCYNSFRRTYLVVGEKMTNLKDPRPLEKAYQAMQDLGRALELVYRVSPQSPIVNLIHLYHNQLQEHIGKAEETFTASLESNQVSRTP